MLSLIFGAWLPLAIMEIQFDNNPTPIANARGVLRYEKSRAQDGLNLVESDADNQCRIYEMDGRYVSSLPGKLCLVLKDGRLLSALRDGKLALLDQNLKILWIKDRNAHHDMSVNEASGEIAYLGKDVVTQNDGRKLYTDYIEVVDFAGRVKFKWDSRNHLDEMSEAFGRKIIPYPYKVHDLTLSHLNSVQIIPAGHPITSVPGFAAGSLIVACFHHSEIFVIDRTGKITWHYNVAGGSYTDRRGVHAAKLTNRGTLLFFKNKDTRNAKGGAKNSSIVELDVRNRSEKILYRADKPGRFFSLFYGSVEALENGNLLVTHVHRGGGAFEVDPAGRIVWEWITPLSNSAGRAIMIYRVTRISRASVAPLLNAAEIAF